MNNDIVKEGRELVKQPLAETDGAQVFIKTEYLIKLLDTIEELQKRTQHLNDCRFCNIKCDDVSCIKKANTIEEVMSEDILTFSQARIMQEDYEIKIRRLQEQLEQKDKEIEAGTIKGAMEIFRRNEKLEQAVEAAKYLKQVKLHKDAVGKDNDWYVANQPIAWQNLFEALNQLNEVDDGQDNNS